MTRFLIILSILVGLNLLYGGTQVMAEEINNGLMTLELSQINGNKHEPVVLKIDVPRAWSMSMSQANNRHDFVFKHLQYPDKIEVQLLQSTFPYTDGVNKASIISNSMQGGLDVLIDSAKKQKAKYQNTKGQDNILSQTIDYSLFTIETIDEKSFFKFMYPSSDSQIFIIYVIFKDGAPFPDAEKLINNLIFAITNSY